MRGRSTTTSRNRCGRVAWRAHRGSASILTPADGVSYRGSAGHERSAAREQLQLARSATASARDILRAVRRASRLIACRERRRERDVRLSTSPGAPRSRRRPQLALTERIEQTCPSGIKCCWRWRAVLLVILVTGERQREARQGHRGALRAGRPPRLVAPSRQRQDPPKKKGRHQRRHHGRITRIAVREGDLVQKGQFLLQIDPTIYQANMQRPTRRCRRLSGRRPGAGDARSITAALTRTKELHEQESEPDSRRKQLEQAQTLFDIADANWTARSTWSSRGAQAFRKPGSAGENASHRPVAGRVTRLASRRARWRCRARSRGRRFVAHDLRSVVSRPR